MIDYTPYGEEIVHETSTDSKTAYGFTGKEYEAETGLSYFGARYYDPKIGRFVSEDPAEGDLNNPQTFNKYAYALNNPIKMIDPNGKYPVTSEVTDLLAGSTLISHMEGLTGSTYNILNSMTNIYAGEFNSHKSSVSEIATSRYIYVNEGGWIDLKHFFTMAQIANKIGYYKALAYGYGVEAYQFKKNDFSAFSFEDLTSNTVGAYFGFYYLPQKLAEGYTESEALKMYFEAMGGVSSQDALENHNVINGYWELPEFYTEEAEKDHPTKYVSSTSKGRIDSKLNSQ
jgi:RHS repeat-associated protein